MKANMVQKHVRWTFLWLSQVLYTPVFSYSLYHNVCDFNGMDISLLETKGQALQQAWVSFTVSILSGCNSSGSILASTETEESEGRQNNQC